MGHGCFRLRGKNATALTDPFPPALGARLPKQDADLVTISHGHPNHSHLDVVGKDAYVIDGPGEYEVRGITVIGLPSFHDTLSGAERGRNTIYLIDVDEVRVCHLGDLGHRLEDSTMESIGTVDVLLVPVGGGNSLGAGMAAEVVRAIEPRWVVPMHYQMGLMSSNLDGVDTFLKEMGVTEAVPQNKLSVQYSASGSDGETKVFLMEPRS